MAHLGSIAKDHLATQRGGIPVIHWKPTSGINLPGKNTLDMLPLFNRVLSPVAVSGSYSLECYTSGRFPFEEPVDPGLTYTVSVYLRKTSGCVSSIQGFRVAPQTLLPCLYVVRSDGTVYKDFMADVVLTWDLLSVTVPVVEQGTLRISIIVPGLPGASGFFIPVALLPNLFVTKTWINYLDITAVQT